ncbi:hypothetical protein [Sphingomonas hankyongi]|uniref:General stress protein 17M-like domain-containing protein n=1 Tax=Sphingomonas hankyongi TaxID=2908209 RepID=A0ABT0S4A9_9SPHN|nr:hypothetical protein [Sphingomonas hankyongi]MCL6730710.1 hypothetical protein [Sphingomonas hankyongi]
MSKNIISAVFDSRSEAESAVGELRGKGIDSAKLSVIGRDEDGATVTDGSGEEASEGLGDTVKGALGGAGIGAILGVAALAIPGVGPLAAAGAIAGSAIPGAAAIGAVAGGLTGMLKDHGVSDEDAKYYEGRINDGGIFVSVDAGESNVPAETVREILSRNGGHNASQPRMATAQ